MIDILISFEASNDLLLPFSKWLIEFSQNEITYWYISFAIKEKIEGWHILSSWINLNIQKASCYQMSFLHCSPNNHHAKNVLAAQSKWEFCRLNVNEVIFLWCSVKSFDIILISFYIFLGDGFLIGILIE